MVKSVHKMMPHIAFGGDYNPEQWDEDVWIEDAKLMKEAGVNLVSVGIFSWSMIEREEDQFDFDWLDRVIEILHEHEIGISLATATASPPAWLSKKYPDILAVQPNGVPNHPGSRQHYSPNSKRFRQAVEKLVRKMAERYGDHPALKMWHVNNEYACHLAECYSDESLDAFRSWLKDKYQTIDALNEGWGTAFWSQRYNDWDEIQFPVNLPTLYNPSQKLDYKRFMNDAILDLYLLEKNILRELTPGIPIFTNFMYEFKPLNYFQWAEQLDFITWDSYPDPRDGKPYRHAMHHDLMRSLKNGKPFYLMEQVTSHVNWRDINLTKKPGEMRLWSYSNVARGGDGVMYFQWRQGRAGAEKFHGAMIPHSNNPESRTYQEVKQLGHELKKLDDLVGATTNAEVVIIFEWENWWAVEHEGKPHNKLSYLDQIYQYYKVLYDKNIAVDFVHPYQDLSKYKVVIAPMLYLMTEKTAENLQTYTAAGGNVIVTFFSGIADENDHIHLGGYPAPIRKLLGLTIEEFAPMADEQHNIIISNGQQYCTTLWADIIQLEGAKVVAYFKEDWYKKKPAVTVNQFGKGRSFYIGTNPEEAYLINFLSGIMNELNIEPPLVVPQNVEVTVRETTDHRFTFILNHNETEVSVKLDQNYVDCLSSETISNQINIPGTDVAILKQEK